MHAGELAHALDRLAHTGRVLYVAAHPDDENTRLLAYLANARHLTVAYLSITRGDGGQNLIGKEQGELLGIIRTQELLAARQLDGAVQRFTRMRDFGYSKTAKETLSQWGHEEALADVVRVYRTFQPDVVLTRFDERPPNHGHHTASAILAREALVAAADPARFPEQLGEGLRPWKVDRLLHNVSPWRDKPPADALKLDVGAYDARLGQGYAELAARSRTQHKSQGFGVPGERGKLVEHFVHVAGTRPTKDLLEGLELGWARFGAQAAALQKAVDEARRTLERDAPERALPALAQAHRALDALPECQRREDAKAALESLMGEVSGLFLRATSPAPAVSPGSVATVKLEVVMRRPGGMTLERALFPGAVPLVPKAGGLVLGTNEKLELSSQVNVPNDAPVSMPYWLGKATAAARHEVTEPGLIGLPEGPAPLEVDVELRVLGRALRLTRPVEYVWTDPVHGERARRVLVAPPATVTPLREAVMVPNGTAARAALRVKGWRDGLSAKVRLPVPAGWTVTPAEQEVSLRKAGDEATVVFEVKAQVSTPRAEVAPELFAEGRRWSVREDVIDYPHLSVQGVLQPSSLVLVPVAVRLPQGRVGYVEGPGDTVLEDLAHLGVRIEPIDEATLRSGELGVYSAIVVGVRAFNTRPLLRSVGRARLSAYAEKGGTVVVQYNTHSRLAPLEGELAPYPLTLGRDRVTDEDAPMLAVDPKHPALLRPNVLGAEDYAGWVQERGLYFAEKWDARFQPVFRIADPDEAPLEGGLLVARHGRGHYVYTGLSFFRQLPAGVPGAYRLLVNLLSLSRR